MIRTWTADVSALLSEDVYQKYYRQVPEFRKKKADALVRQEDKALSIGAWVLFEKMKRAYHLREDVLFNLSHSGSYALCSVSDAAGECEKFPERLGCDLEKIKEPKMDVAKRFFCRSEYQKIKENPDLFYRYWVLKESYLKATREGIRLGMDSFEIQFTEKNKFQEPYLVKYPEKFPEICYFKEYRIETLPYCIAVCADKNEFDLSIQKIVLG